ncbi:MAG: AsnC family protein [Pseudomonadota bacterium]
MELGTLHKKLISALKDGLPLVPEPYAALAEKLDIETGKLCQALEELRDGGIINRFGLIVHHRALGYNANAMCVFDIDDASVSAIGRAIAALPYVTLCYQRIRVPGVWPYNLYCMIHGQDRLTVRAQIRHLIARLDLADIPHRVLFSRRCFSQCGGDYGQANDLGTVTPLPTPMAGEYHDPA